MRFKEVYTNLLVASSRGDSSNSIKQIFVYSDFAFNFLKQWQSHSHELFNNYINEMKLRNHLVYFRSLVDVVFNRFCTHLTSKNVIYQQRISYYIFSLTEYTQAILEFILDLKTSDI